jgi:hypothetical protein
MRHFIRRTGKEEHPSSRRSFEGGNHDVHVVSLTPSVTLVVDFDESMGAMTLTRRRRWSVSTEDLRMFL